MHDPLDLVGDVLDGQYRIDEVVGEGAMTIVYRGTNTGVHAPVAIKCLNLPPTLDAALSQPLVDSFQEGCKLHYQLARGSLAIAQVIASGTTLAPRTGGQVPYLVREWFEGEPLSMNLSRRRAEGEQGRTLEESVKLLQPAAEGLAYAHTQNVPHLSVNPTNLFLASVGPKSSMKVLDFGLAKVEDHRTPGKKEDGVGLHFLFPAYAAPEQLLRTVGPIGPWTDVYAFMLVFLEVLSDRLVMTEKDPGAIAQRTLHATLRVSPKVHGVELPADVDALFASALALDPKKRPVSVGDLWQRLLRLIPRSMWVVTSSIPPPSNRAKKQGPLLRRVRRSRRSRLLGIALRRQRRVLSIDTRATLPPARASLRVPRPSNRPPASTRPTARPEARSSRVPPPMPRRRVDVVPPPLPQSAWAPPRVPTIDFEPESHEIISIPPSAAAAPVESAPPTPKVEAPSVPPPPADLIAVEASLFPAPPPVEATKPVNVPVPVPVPAPVAVPAPVFEPPPPPPAAPYIEPVPDSKKVPPAHTQRVRRIATLAALAVVGVAMFVLFIALAKSCFSSSSQPLASTSAHTHTPTPLPSPSPSPSVIASTPPTATTPPTPTATGAGRFDKRVAIRALDVVGSDLTPCKRKNWRGVWGTGNAGVQFRNDGTVVRVTMGAPFQGTVEGQCIIDTLKRAVIPPYTGIVGMIYYSFVLPP